MHHFQSLIQKLDQTNKRNEKLEALVLFITNASEKNVLWGVYLLTGNTVSIGVSFTDIKNWAKEYTELPDWLWDEVYGIVGDSAETIALLLENYHKTAPTRSRTHDIIAQNTASGETKTGQLPLSLNTHVNELKQLRKYKSRIETLRDGQLHTLIQFLQEIKKKSKAEKKMYLWLLWETFDRFEIFILLKIIRGSFRVGVSKQLVQLAIAQAYTLNIADVAVSLSREWHPETTDSLSKLLSTTQEQSLSFFPFYLASSLDRDISELGKRDDWIVEWKWDGIRVQVMIDDYEVAVWSRGEELVTEQFPELQILKESLPNGTIIDGELVVKTKDGIQSFNHLQQRLGRKHVSSEIQQKYPVHIIAYDVLALNHQDLRDEPLVKRKELLHDLIDTSPSTPSHIQYVAPITAVTWDDVARKRSQAREMRAEGVMIKYAFGEYKGGRPKGEWWKWKLDPFTLDVVLLYAQRGRGQRANMYTDYTFAVWDESKSQLLPIAKAYSGLDDTEIAEVDTWIKKHTKERFGPVRSVTPELVFEIGFEGIQKSSRHKSGYSLRLPRIVQRRFDKKLGEIDSVCEAAQLLQEYEGDTAS